MSERDYDAGVDLHDSYYAAVGALRQEHEATQVPAVLPGNVALRLPGTRTRTSLSLPATLSQEDWIACGQLLSEVEGAVQWWIGDWWAFGDARHWGKSEAAARLVGVSPETAMNYGSVARAFDFSSRDENLSFTHHRYAMAAEESERPYWLEQALFNSWSTNQLRAAIQQGAAVDRTHAVELQAESLGKFAVLYADPPWRYEHPPMGGSNRSIENHYPTMALEDICALPVGDIAHDDSVLFLWATSPKLYECMSVLDAWGFNYRTSRVWVKDKIGMGYYARGRHELLLIAARGALPIPAAEDRPDSVIEAPRLDHSAKPDSVYDDIDQMYPGVRKLELFQRQPRDGWLGWGNQVAEAAE